MDRKNYMTLARSVIIIKITIKKHIVKENNLRFDMQQMIKQKKEGSF